MKKAILVIGVLVVLLCLLSGCLEEATWTMRGKVTSIEKYVSGDKTILVIGLNNGSKREFEYESIKKYNIKLGDEIIIKMEDIFQPYNVKEVYIKENHKI